MKNKINASNYIDGKWVVGTGEPFSVVNPADGVTIWQGRSAAEVEVQGACKAARSHFPLWEQASLAARVDICCKFRDLLKLNIEELSELISQDVGKPLWEARSEVASMANKIDISIQSYHVRTGHFSNEVNDGSAVLRHRPHGVFAVLGPYNFPGHLPNGHIVPALIAGNTIVFKPSEYVVRTSMKMMEYWIEAGLPKGVLNLVSGGKNTGISLTEHSEIDGVLFTGSYAVGVSLHKKFAGQPEKMLALEMGGNNPLIVWNVENRDAAVHHIILSAFISAGQRCTCARRLILPANTQGEVILKRLVQVASAIRVGKYNLSPAPFMGPVISCAAARKLIDIQAELISRGGRPLLEMRHLQANTGLVSAGIVDVTDVNQVPDEEWFGPLLQVIRVPDFAAAISVANATRYGLAAGLLSDDVTLWQQFQSRIRAGIVNWNRPTTGAASTAPFGGIGRSGNNRPSAFYAADYCAYPVASTESVLLELPKQLTPGLTF
jgi:succinylglutamic semialdehyde dehydrogenase